MEGASIALSAFTHHVSSFHLWHLGQQFLSDPCLTFLPEGLQICIRRQGGSLGFFGALGSAFGCGLVSQAFASLQDEGMQIGACASQWPCRHHYGGRRLCFSFSSSGVQTFFGLH